MKNNPAKAKPFKRIVSSFWFWLVIAIISYIIFASMPIQWDASGYGWNAWEGINLYKSLFGYLYVFAFLITVVLIGVAIIKRIQKSSIGDYWKISFTVIGIIILMVFAFFYLKQYIPTGSSEVTKQDLNELKENSSIGFLTEQGYDVLSLSFGSYSAEMARQNKFTTDTNCYPYQGSAGDWTNGTCWSNYTQAYVEMKSLGTRNSQIWDALTAFAGYRYVSIYRIDILEPQQTCTYFISGKTYNAYTSVDIINNYSEENLNRGRELAKNVNAEIEKYKTCS